MSHINYMPWYLVAIYLSLVALPSHAGDASPSTRPVEMLHMQTIEFIAEQDGSFEHEVKSALMPVLKTYSEVKSAYLVAVLYGGKDQGVALCLSADHGAEKNIVNSIAKVFSNIAGRNVHMDIIFLTSEQRKRVNEVAHAFYIRS